MSIKLDKNPYKKDGDWHTYDISFSSVDSEKDGKVIELIGLEETSNKTLRNPSGKELSLHGLMTLENAAKIHKTLGEKLKEFGDYETEIIKNLVLERLAQSSEPVRLTKLEEEFLKQGIPRTKTFAAIAELYKLNQKINEVVVDKRPAYELAKRS